MATYSSALLAGLLAFVTSTTVTAQCVSLSENFTNQSRIIYVDEFNGSDQLARSYTLGQVSDPFNPRNVAPFLSVETASSAKQSARGDVILIKRGRDWIPLSVWDNNQVNQYREQQQRYSTFTKAECEVRNLTWLQNAPMSPAQNTTTLATAPSESTTTSDAEIDRYSAAFSTAPLTSEQVQSSSDTSSTTTSRRGGGNAGGGSSSKQTSDASPGQKGQANNSQRSSNQGSSDSQTSDSVFQEPDDEISLVESQPVIEEQIETPDYNNQTPADSAVEEPPLAKAPSPAICTTNVPWESQIYRYPQDANGHSILTPNSDTRIIYVSSSEGNDDLARPYMSGENKDPFLPEDIIPYRTIEKAMSVARDGKPDWVLLKRGDYFELESTIWIPQGSGRGANFVFSSYGTSLKRPVVDSGANSAVRKNSMRGYLAIMGIDFYASNRDPNNEKFAGWDNINNASAIATITGNQPAVDVFIENNIFRFYSGVGFQGNSAHNNLVIRNNVFRNAYSTTAHAQGLYIDNVNLVLVENNIFDHNGWNRQRPADEPQGSRTQGNATWFNHNMYFGNLTNTVIRNNLVSRASSIGIKLTSNPKETNYIISKNILIVDNLFIEGEVGISAGGNTNHRDGHRWGNMIISNNTISNLGRTRPTRRDISWGIDVQDWNKGEVCGNVITDNLINTNTYGIKLVGFNTDVSLSDNMIVNTGVSNEKHVGDNFENITSTNDMYLRRIDSVNFLDEKLATDGYPSYDAYVSDMITRTESDITHVNKITGIKHYLRLRAQEALQ